MARASDNGKQRVEGGNIAGKELMRILDKKKRRELKTEREPERASDPCDKSYYSLPQSRAILS